MDEHTTPAPRRRCAIFSRPGLHTCAAVVVIVGYYFVRFRGCILTFFALDDFWLLDAAAHVRGVAQIVLPAKSRGAFLLYRPFSQVGYFFLLQRLFGYDPSGYHALQLGAHVCNALLVFGIVRRLSASTLGALAGAMLYAAAPGHIVSIYWIAAFAMTGSSLVVLSAVYLWLRTNGFLRVLGCTLLQGVGLLTSEHTVVIPVVLGIVSVLGPPRERPGRVACQLAVPTTLVAAYLGAKVWYFSASGALRTSVGYGVDFDLWRWLAHLARYGAACVNALTLLQRPAPVWALGGVAIVGVAALSAWKALRGSRSWELLAAGTAIFVVSLLPVLPLHDHYFDYFIGTAAMGAALAILGLCRLATRSWDRLAAGCVATVMLIDVATAGSAAQGNDVYRLVLANAYASASWVRAVQQVAETGAKEVLVVRNTLTWYVFGLGHSQDLFAPTPLKLGFYDAARPPSAADGVVVLSRNPPMDPAEVPLPGWQPQLSLLRRLAGGR